MDRRNNPPVSACSRPPGRGRADRDLAAQVEHFGGQVTRLIADYRALAVAPALELMRQRGSAWTGRDHGPSR